MNQEQKPSKPAKTSTGKGKDKKGALPLFRQIGDIIFLDEEGNEVRRSTQSLSTKATIREIVFKIIEETNVIPSIKDIAEISGYSKAVVSRHLNELNPDLDPKYRQALYPLTGKILKAIANKAIEGDMKAAELWLAFIHKFKVNDPLAEDDSPKEPRTLKIAGQIIKLG